LTLKLGNSCRRSGAVPVEASAGCLRAIGIRFIENRQFGPRRRASGAAGNQHQLAAQGNLTSQLTRIGKRRFC